MRIANPVMLLSNIFSCSLMSLDKINPLSSVEFFIRNLYRAGINKSAGSGMATTLADPEDLRLVIF